MKHFLTLFILFLLSACAMRYTPPVIENKFSNTPIPAPPDYSQNNSWASLPEKKDLADLTPKNITLSENQQNAPVDVFFIHPTTYTYAPNTPYLWNGNLDDIALNKRTDESTIKNQASIFNAAGKIYAPRYRQAHIYAFFTPQKEDGNQALSIAYQDICAAFEYYLANYNHGRPFIIAAHSQGTFHAGNLIKKYILNTPLQNQFVAAYLVGLPVPKNYFEGINFCSSPEETGCFVSWNTFAEGFYPTRYKEMGYENAVCINPITWTNNDNLASRKLNKGGVVWKFKVIPKINSAQVKDGLLWICKPYIPGRMFYKVKNYHIGDYNLFYENVRENAVLRSNIFIEKKQADPPELEQK